MSAYHLTQPRAQFTTGAHYAEDLVRRKGIINVYNKGAKNMNKLISREDKK
jgi:hypothetical protein